MKISNNIKQTYDNKYMADYVYEILSLNVCDSFFSGSFVREDDYTRGFYDTYGYRRLASYTKIKVEQYFDLLSALLVLLGKARMHYINPDNLVINENTVYVGKTFRDVKIIPVFDFKTEEGKHMEAFLNWIYYKVPEKDRGYVKASWKYASDSEVSDREAQTAVARMSREARIST